MTSGRQLGLLWGAVAVLLVGLSPLAERLTGNLPACPIKVIIGMPCLSCGTTRAALALARLDMAAALTINPLAAAGWLALVGGGLIAGVLALVGRPISEPTWHLSPGWRCLLVAVLVANWAYLIWIGA